MNIENDRKMEMPEFEAGDRVKICSHWPPSPPIHCRTPYYVRGCSGTIERYCGEFPDPEELAFGRKDVSRLSLYRVRFVQKDLWDNYTGSSKDQIEIEIYETWLEKI